MSGKKKNIVVLFVMNSIVFCAIFNKNKGN